MSSIRLERSTALAVWRLLLNTTGIRKHRKVFAVGFNKCATTSLHALFLELGLPSYHGTKWRSCDNWWLFRAFDCFSDGIPADLQKLDRQYPNSKFVLQVRDLQGWVYSRLAHIDRSKRDGYYPGGLEWDTTEHAVTSWILQRNRHHMAVLDLFASRPNDLLVVNFIRDPSAGSRVAHFLGFDGKFERPEDNVNPEKAVPAAYRALLEQSVAKLGLSETEVKFDILCPTLLPDSDRQRYPADTDARRR